VQNCSLTTDKLDDLIDFAVSTNETNGQLKMRYQNPTATISNFSGVSTLLNRGWFVDYD